MQEVDYIPNHEGAEDINEFRDGGGLLEHNANRTKKLKIGAIQPDKQRLLI